LRAVFTEVGTLEIWCESRVSEHRWRLQFNLRATEAQEPEPAEASGEVDARTGVVVPDEAIAEAEALLRGTFSPAPGGPGPDALVGDLEQALGHGKQAWPLPAIRRLADVLIETAEGRRLSARHEARWLNLIGYCLRPGFGTARDPWRVAE